MRLAGIVAAFALALGLTACSRTPIPVFRDAAVGVRAAPDVGDDTNIVPTLLDASPPSTADSAASVSDAGIAADSVVAVPDAAPPAADSAVVFSDVPTWPGDGASPESPEVLPDVARDSGVSETAAAPYLNRTFEIDPQHPAPTADPTCTQYRDNDYIRMVFGSDITTLAVLAVRGSAAMPFSATLGPESDKLTYHVTNFLGGGVITFEQDQGVYVAQVILYGSGVPIVQCLRGALTPQP